MQQSPPSHNEVAVLPHQREFILSNAVHTGLVAGFGSGKSLAATVKICMKKLEYPGVNMAYYLPTYGLIRDIAKPNISKQLDELGVRYTYNERDHDFTTSFGKIILRSLSDPESIVGYEVGYSVIDEADIQGTKKMRKCMVKIVARNRTPLPDGAPNCIDLISTPEGFGFMYDFFVKDGDKKGRRMIKAKTADNIFLPDGYIPMLREIYTSEELDAYLEGEFVNLTSGIVHHTFKRGRNHSDRTRRPKELLHIGMDFNITNMSAVAHVLDGRNTIAVDEITGAYDTADMIQVIRDKFSGHRITVYPDASGNSRKTSASDTDIKLLKKARFKVVHGASNPRVKDRITTMNSGFLDADNRTTYFVNTSTCPVYTECLEKLVYKNNQPDKENGFDHLPEAAGYAYYSIKTPNFARLHAR